MNDQSNNQTLKNLTADIVSAHVGNNSVAVGDLAQLITNVHSALSALGAPKQSIEPRAEPKVSIRSSVKPDHIVCLEDGKRMKMLKRHLMTDHNMTPDQYRQRWGLNSDYPMVAPDYAELRRTLAKSIGLGTKGSTATKVPSAKTKTTRAPRKTRATKAKAASKTDSGSANEKP